MGGMTGVGGSGVGVAVGVAGAGCGCGSGCGVIQVMRVGVEGLDSMVWKGS